MAARLPAEGIRYHNPIRFVWNPLFINKLDCGNVRGTYLSIDCRESSFCILLRVFERPFSELDGSTAFVLQMLHSVKAALLKCVFAVNGAIRSGHCRVWLDIDVFGLPNLSQSLCDFVLLVQRILLEPWPKVLRNPPRDYSNTRCTPGYLSRVRSAAKKLLRATKPWCIRLTML